MVKKILSRLKKKITNKSELQVLIDGGMKVGENCSFYSVSTIDSNWPWLISFGNNVTISTNVTILAHDASPNIIGSGTKLGKVVIGNNVFIGTGSTILCNTIIGDNVLIGAGSLVSGTLESNGVYGGIPARKISTISEYREKIINQKKERPDLSTIRKWNEWKEASKEEKQKMKDLLEDGCGFV